MTGGAHRWGIRGGRGGTGGGPDRSAAPKKKGPNFSVVCILVIIQLFFIFKTM